MDAKRRRTPVYPTPYSFFRGLSPAAWVGVVLFVIALSLTIIGIGIESVARDQAPAVFKQPGWLVEVAHQKASLAT